MSKNYKSLSKKYRESGKGNLSEKEVEAYIAARMPATFAAICEVLKKIPFPITSLLDFGAGPGTGWKAALEIFGEVERATLIEQNEKMIEYGVKDAKVRWMRASIYDVKPDLHDLGLFSYSFGELLEERRKEVLKRAWDACTTLSIIEPGTPRGYENVMQARDALFEMGAELLAPCPHMRPCPMRGNDWCHFSIRLERSREHKTLKKAELGYEDEKFSYVIFSKEKTQRSSRIVRHPIKGKGHVKLKVCSDEGLQMLTITKKQGSIYKSARKVVWGDSWGQGTSSQGPQPH